MIDEMIKEVIPHNIILRKIPILHAKKVYLIRAKENDFIEKKSYLRSLLVMIDDELITSTYADTILFFAELRLFDGGNKQNKYFSIETIDKIKNLKLQLSDKNIYISKSEAMAMSDIYTISKHGLSMMRILEDELKFSLNTLAEYLLADGFFDNEQ